MFLISVTVFWTCAVLISYTYVGYPLLIWLLSRWFGRSLVPRTTDLESLPEVTLLIAAHNEEDVIEKRIRNALRMDYPRERLKILIGLDGCDDKTMEIVERFVPEGVRVLDFAQRRGKASILNAAMAEVKSPIVLMSDANTEIDSKAARRLVRWFTDPVVGAVVGRLLLTEPGTGNNVDSSYWKYENFLKHCEGRLGALLGANGAIYAIRRDLYVSIPPETIIDDFVIPLLARLHSECSIIYDCEALAREETPANVSSEFHRRARIGAGGFQSIGLLWMLLDPRRGWVAFSFFSHKLLRWLCPFFLIGIFITNVFLCNHRFYRWTLVAQVVSYGLSIAAAVAPRGIKPPKLISLAMMFTSMNAALLVGFVRWISKQQGAAWRRTARVAEAGRGLR